MRLASVLVAAAFATSSFAQEAKPNPRYEIMWRMRELDREWRSHASGQERREALASLSTRASGFGRDVAVTARVFDEARFRLSDWSHANAVEVKPSCRLQDAEHVELQLDISQFYGTPSLFEWGVSLEASSDHFTIDLNQGPAAWQPQIRPLNVGDHSLRLSICDADAHCSHRSLQVSVVEHRDARLAALDEAIAQLPENAPQLERLTAAMLDRLMYSLRDGFTRDTDYPGARLLAEAEQVVAAAAKGKRFYSVERTGQFWIALPVGPVSTGTVARVLVPKNLARDRRVPLVVALHGEGFSENTFFDCYGGGQIAKLCEQRGWLLVAPRDIGEGNARLAAIADLFGSIYPVDRSRVFVVGHSSGAERALAAARDEQLAFRAIAALGMAHEVQPTDALAKTAIFIGSGDHDPGRDAAKKLADSLQSASSQLATFKLYPNCEHLMICADALPDVFAWFSSLAH